MKAPLSTLQPSRRLKLNRRQASKEKSDIEHLKEKGDNIVERIEEEKTFRDG